MKEEQNRPSDGGQEQTAPVTDIRRREQDSSYKSGKNQSLNSYGSSECILSQTSDG